MSTQPTIDKAGLVSPFGGFKRPAGPADPTDSEDDYIALRRINPGAN